MVAPQTISATLDGCDDDDDDDDDDVDDVDDATSMVGFHSS